MQINASHPKLVWIAYLLVSLILLSGCNSIQVLSTKTATAVTNTPQPPTNTLLPPTATATPPPPTATETATSTFTPAPTSTSTETPTNTAPPPTPKGEDAISIYMIQTETGGPIACGDTAIPINTGLWRSGDIELDVATALRNLFVKRQYIAGLYNPAYLSNIQVDSVDFQATLGEVDVMLSGTYVRSGDHCDSARVRAQVWSTIRQFQGVKTVYILLNGNLLGDILAGK